MDKIRKSRPAFCRSLAAEPARRKSKKKLLSLCIASGVFLITLLSLILLSKSNKASAALHRSLSRGIIYFMGHVSSLFPFSLYEMFLYLAGFFLLSSLTAIILFAIKRRWIRSLRVFMSVVLTCLVVGTVYFASAGFAYTQTGSGVNLFEDHVNQEQLKQICTYFLDDFNSLAARLERDKDGNVIQPYSDKVLSDKLIKEYERVSGKNLNTYTPRAKNISSSTIMSQMQIRGVFFAPFGEANINKKMPAFEKPYTMAHEMAHAKGIMLEDEADMMASFITLTSSDDFIRYSGYMDRIYYLFSGFYDYNNYDQFSFFWSSRDTRIKKELSNSSEFWSKHNFFGRIFNTLNDFYLKLMGQKAGTAAYSPEPGGTTEIQVTDPETGDPVFDPGTDLPILEIVPEFNGIQRLFFKIYEDSEIKT